MNMATREWKDGLLSSTMRDLANMPDDNPKWIILDGDLGKRWVGEEGSVGSDPGGPGGKDLSCRP